MLVNIKDFNQKNLRGVFTDGKQTSKPSRNVNGNKTNYRGYDFCTFAKIV